MKKSSKNKIGWIAVILVFGILFYFGFLQSTYSSSVISYGGFNVPLKTGEFDLWSSKATYETAWLGSISAGDLKTYSDGGIDASSRTQLQQSKSYSVMVGNTNDAGTVSLSNSYSVSGNTLSLSSSVSTPKACDKTTGIKVKVTVPKGTITGTCNNKMTAPNGEMLNYGCGIDGKKELTNQYPYSTQDYSETQTFSQEVEGEITLYTYTTASCKTTTSVASYFTFTATPVTSPSTGNAVIDTTSPTTQTTTTNPSTTSNTQNASLESPQSTISPQGWFILGVISLLGFWILYNILKREGIIK